MLRIVMFDLGATLVDAQRRPFPHVPEALAAIAGMRTADGRPLRTCLVSDFDLPTPPVTPAKVRALFGQYLALLETTGLRPAFEPVQRRVTLSTHAGARKPERVVFETAIRRLRVKAALEDCLLVTEDAAHVAAVRRHLHMAALRFRSTASPRFDFDDWSQAPALIAQRIDPRRADNLQAAAGAFLAARDVELSTLEPAGSPDRWQFTGQRWCPAVLPGRAAPLHVGVPVAGRLERGPDGALRAELPPPVREEVAEAAAFARSVLAHGQVGARGTPRGGATHEIVVDERGRERLVRRRFSAR